MLTSGRRLESWKEIADYVGRDVRTVMRWERDRGFPVHRLPGGRGSTVFAMTDEIDAWRRGDQPSAADGGSPIETPLVAAPPADPVRRRFNRRVPLLVGLAAILFIFIAWATVGNRSRTPPANPARVSVAGQVLTAVDAEGRTLWTHDFGRPLVSSTIPPFAVVDLDDDGDVELVVAVPFDNPGGGFSEDELVCFAANGQVKWQLRATDRVTFKDQTYGSPWVGSALVAYGPPGARAVAWAVHHYTWWPAQLMRVSPTGQVTHRFAHPGWITHVCASPDGSWLVASGVNNALNANVTAILDGRDFGGGPPLSSDSPYACRGCTPSGLHRYLVFPYTEIHRAGLFPFGPTLSLIRPDGTGQIRIAQTPNEPEVAEVLYELDRDFRIKSGAYSDSYWRWHTRLESEHRLTHDADHCPARVPPGVATWQPGTPPLPTSATSRLHVVQPIADVAGGKFQD